MRLTALAESLASLDASLNLERATDQVMTMILYLRSTAKPPADQLCLGLVAPVMTDHPIPIPTLGTAGALQGLGHRLLGLRPLFSLSDGAPVMSGRF